MTAPQDSPSAKEATGGETAKLLVLAAIALAVALLAFLFREQLSLEQIAGHEQRLRQYQSDHPLLVLVIAFCIYVSVTAASLPGATVLSLSYAWFFGFLPALVLVSFASTTGATGAFLVSRYFLRDFIQRRFGERLATFNQALAREGAFYLFTLRLIPAVPFFVINVVMGLTTMRVRTFWWVSQVGMLAGTCVYVYAGSSIPSLEQIIDRSQIRREDIQHWPGLVAELSGASDLPPEEPTRRIWDELPPAVQDRLSRSTGNLSDADKLALIESLNRLLKRPDFALHPAWQNSPLEQKELTAMNRRLLETALPKYIRSPQPILSWRLFLAFSALGVFPLAVKKVANHRKRQADPPDSSEEQVEGDDGEQAEADD